MRSARLRASLMAKAVEPSFGEGMLHVSYVRHNLGVATFVCVSGRLCDLRAQAYLHATLKQSTSLLAETL